MNNEALYKISYGLFILSAHADGNDNACIINTAIQVSDSPNILSISINKSNYTHDMIMKTGKFTISVINQDADFELFKHFGFQTGKNIDKFKNFQETERNKDGILYVTKSTNAYISVNVDKTIDLPSHTIFIGGISDMQKLNDVPSATYEYYFNNIKPKPTNDNTENQTIWRCKICGYEYKGENLPPNFICPLCKHSAADFEKIEK